MNPIIQKTFDQVRSLFIYIPDKEQFPGKWDDWQSYVKLVQSGKVFKDDCDGFCLTCAEMLFINGFLKDLISIVLCKTETGESHLVCTADDFLLDNRQRIIWRWHEVPYQWVSSMRLSEPGVWREML